MNKLKIAFAVPAIMSGHVFAAGASFDARNDAMGGVGVASSNYSVAAPVNPALVAKYKTEDDFAVVLPSIGALVADQDSLVDVFDDIDNHYKQYNDLVNSGGNAQAAAGQLSQDFKKAQGKNAAGNVGVNLQVAMPNELMSVSVFGNAYATGIIGSNVTQSDLDYLDGVASGTLAADPAHKFNSTAVGVVAVVQDYGIALAHKFELSGMPLYVGVTPKVQKIETFNYSANIYDYNIDDVTDDKYRSSESHVNADLGAALDVGSFTYGATIRNIISKDVTTKDVAGSQYIYQVAPVGTIGAAYSNDWVTVAADVDVNKTKTFKGVKDSQYASIGTELDIAKWLQVRAGYRADISGEMPNVFTAGLGVSPWDVFHIDLAGQIGSDNAVGAMLTTRLTF